MKLWKWHLWVVRSCTTGHGSTIEYTKIHYREIWLFMGFVLGSVCRRTIPYQISVSKSMSLLQIAMYGRETWHKLNTGKNLVKAALYPVEENDLILPLLSVCHLASCNIGCSETEKSTPDFFIFFKSKWLLRAFTMKYVPYSFNQCLSCS